MTLFYEADGLGSVTSLTDSSGAVANTYMYDSFGNNSGTTGTVDQPFRFTSRELDSETGLYYYRARYYESPTGRFLSEDPMRFAAGVNSYAYVDNSPINLRDPSGLCKLIITFTPVGLGAYHAAIIAIDKSGATITRAGASDDGLILPLESPGPEQSCTHPVSNSTLFADQTGYGPGHIDFAQNPPTTQVVDDGIPCETYNRKLRDFVKQTNAAQIPYGTFTRNSNTFAHEAIQSLGFSPSAPPVWAPGWKGSLSANGRR